MIRTVNSVRNVKWADYNQTRIDMEVDFDELDEVFVPFTATPDDVEPHGVTLYNNAINGDYGTIGAFEPPSNITGEEAMEYLRHTRTKLLEDTDFIEIPTKWASLTADEQTSWTTYRNALRDLPANYPNAEMQWNADYSILSWANVTFPTKPE